jgi:hypothetical protein
VDSVFSAFGWLLDHKVISTPIAGALVVGALVTYLVLRRGEPAPRIDASGGGKVQQTELRDVSATGDVTVHSDQR